jgi:hypothetical protein
MCNVYNTTIQQYNNTTIQQYNNTTIHCDNAYIRTCMAMKEGEKQIAFFATTMGTICDESVARMIDIWSFRK